MIIFVIRDSGVFMQDKPVVGGAGVDGARVGVGCPVPAGGRGRQREGPERAGAPRRRPVPRPREENRSVRHE